MKNIFEENKRKANSGPFASFMNKLEGRKFVVFYSVPAEYPLFSQMRERVFYDQSDAEKFCFEVNGSLTQINEK
jgi:hypothetical protein